MHLDEPHIQLLHPAALVQQIAEWIGQTLQRRRLIERDAEKAWLAGDGSRRPLADLIGQSITYRVAAGPRAGHRLCTLDRDGPKGRDRSARRYRGRGQCRWGALERQAAILRLLPYTCTAQRRSALDFFSTMERSIDWLMWCIFTRPATARCAGDTPGLDD